MKPFLVLFCVFLLSIVAGKESVCANSNNTFNSQVKVLRVDKTSSLSRAFEKISKLPKFHTMSKSELDGMFPKKLGSVKCVVYGNADPRQKVLAILKEIPKELLYSVHHTKNDKITRIYIEESANGEVQMLYAFVGKGGNDLLVSLFSGASLSVYQKEGDSLKEYSFEEMEGYVTNFNAECPKVMGLTSEITSMAINRRYWTVRMKVNTFGKGFVEEYEGDGAKDIAKTMIKGFNKEQISAIFNLNVGFKLVLTTENDETRTIVLESLDIAEILNDTDTTPLEILNMFIETNKKSCPLDWQNGMVMTIMGKNTSKEVGEDKAVDYVSKVDCDEFVSLLKKWTGINFALPTEAQWEFAARGGNYSKGYVYSGGNYKVHWLNEYSYVVRGGDYLSGKKECRVSYRACWSQKNKDKTIGLRLIIANDCV